MSCRDPRPILLNSKISFPLERMHHLITHNIWSEPDSRQQWIEAFPGTPYQLWDNDPFSTDAPLKVQNIEMVCPFCNKTIILELATFTLMHTRKNFRCSCPKCNVQFDADRLSAENLRQDLLKVLKSENKNWYRLATALKSDLPCRFVKGVQFEVDGTERVTSDIDNDFNLILHENEIHSPRGVKIANQGTALARYVTLHPARTNDIPSWKKLFLAFQNTVRQLKAAGVWRQMNRRNVFARLRVAYQGLVWRDLSIDLVAAALRQRNFAQKITGKECEGIDSPQPLLQAITRYHKFMMLLKRSEGLWEASKRQNHLVPTLDIDLCWHTHQLHPVDYRNWCGGQLGRFINHDDTIGKNDLKDGLRDTSLAWFKAYREPYTTDDLKKEYMTTGRKVAGVLMPLYGLHVWNKGRKLAQAQRGIR
jgi:hypothetical protein